MNIFHAETFIDGSGNPPQKDMEIFVENGVIKEIAPAGKKERPQEAKVYKNAGETVIPGFIDVHTHLMFGTSRSYEDVIQNDSDALMVMRAPRNAYLHLRAGVTTLRDCGARNMVGINLKEGAEKGLFLSPRVLACGRPLTITGGHFWWCGQEADGVDGVRAAVRQLLKDGADFLKIMASGGGTQGTDSTRASFTVEELRAVVEEIHNAGKKATAHCLAAEAVVRCAEAGVDQIEHFNFLMPDGTRVFNERAAEMILKKGLVVSPTIQTGYRQIEALQAKGDNLTPEERKQLDANIYKLDTKLDFLRRFHKMGVPVVMGTDAIREFGDYAIGLDLMYRSGLSPMELIVSATSAAAKAIDMGDKVGTLKPGMLADFIYLDGNPLTDAGVFNQVAAVVLNGQLVIDKRLEEAVNIPLFASGMLGLYPNS